VAENDRARRDFSGALDLLGAEGLEPSSTEYKKIHTAVCDAKANSEAAPRL